MGLLTGQTQLNNYELGDRSVEFRMKHRETKRWKYKGEGKKRGDAIRSNCFNWSPRIREVSLEKNKSWR